MVDAQMKPKKIEVTYDYVRSIGVKLFSRPNACNLRFRSYRIGREKKYSNEMEISSPPPGMRFYLVTEGGVKKLRMVK